MGCRWQPLFLRHSSKVRVAISQEFFWDSDGEFGFKLSVIPDEMGYFLVFLWGYTELVVWFNIYLINGRQDVTTRNIVSRF